MRSTVQQDLAALNFDDKNQDSALMRHSAMERDERLVPKKFDGVISVGKVHRRRGKGP